MIRRGDCLEVLDSIPESSLDACITDPPYHLTSIVKRFGKRGSAPAKGDVYNRSARGFMGQEWDGGDIAFRPETWAKVLRVLKPGAYIAAFSGTRTYHRMACAMEDAGFECIDMIEWLYGSGFPKSRNQKDEYNELTGRGTALKPAHEPIALMRKPREGSFEDNYWKHGTGYMEIDAMRVPLNGDTVPEFELNPDKPGNMPGSSAKVSWCSRSTGRKRGGEKVRTYAGGSYRFKVGDDRDSGTDPFHVVERDDQGRWPANVAHDGSDAVLAEFPHTKSGKGDQDGLMHPKTESDSPSLGKYSLQENVPLIGDEGSAARFFYCAKPSKAEKEGGLGDLPTTDQALPGSKISGTGKRIGEGQVRANIHPTVKPVNLMRWLVRGLVPHGGTLIDPFLGSGTTAIAAILEGRYWVGVERDEHYANIAQARIDYWTDKHIEEFLS